MMSGGNGLWYEVLKSKYVGRKNLVSQGGGPRSSMWWQDLGRVCGESHQVG